MSWAATKVRGKHDAPKSRSAHALYPFGRHRQGGSPHGLKSAERGIRGSLPEAVPGRLGQEAPAHAGILQLHPDPPDVDLKLVAPTSREFFVVGA